MSCVCACGILRKNDYSDGGKENLESEGTLDGRCQSGRVFQEKTDHLQQGFVDSTIYLHVQDARGDIPANITESVVHTFRPSAALSFNSNLESKAPNFDKERVACNVARAIHSLAVPTNDKADCTQFLSAPKIGHAGGIHEVAIFEAPGGKYQPSEIARRDATEATGSTQHLSNLGNRPLLGQSARVINSSAPKGGKYGFEAKVDRTQMTYDPCTEPVQGEVPDRTPSIPCLQEDMSYAQTGGLQTQNMFGNLSNLGRSGKDGYHFCGEGLTKKAGRNFAPALSGGCPDLNTTATSTDKLDRTNEDPSVTPLGTSGGIVERLQRALACRSRLEAENRRKLELSTRQKQDFRQKCEQHATERRNAKVAAEVKSHEEKMQRQYRLQQARREQEAAQLAANEERQRMQMLLDEQDKIKNPVVDAKDRHVSQCFQVCHEGKIRTRDVDSDDMTPRHAPLTRRKSALLSTLVSAQVPSRDFVCPDECISYEMSPYRSGSDSDEDMGANAPRKAIPRWARTELLVPLLTKQATLDPDEIFRNPSKTCSLDAVFAITKEKKDGRRSSSGNWFDDRLTWREELTYKRNMGFVARK